MNTYSPTRIVGMSRRMKTQPLLKTLPGSKPEPESEPKQKARLKVPKPLEPIESAESIYAPPASSDSEDDDDPKLGPAGGTESVLKSSPQPSLIDSSDIEEPPRGNITRTEFTSSGRSDAFQSRQTGGQKGKTRRSPESQPNKRRRLSNDSIPSTSSADHLKTGIGFTRQTKAKVKYGGKKATSSQESRTAKEAMDDAPPEFRRPLDDDSPQKPRNSKIIVPKDKIGESPSRGSRSKRLNLKHHEGHDEEDDDLSSPKAKRSLIAPKSLVASPEPNPRPKRKANPLIKPKRMAGRKSQPRASKSPSPPPSPPAAKFQIPVQVSDFKPRETTDDELEDELFPDFTSEVNSDEFPSLTAEPEKEAKLDTNEASCPWCGAPVEKKFLQEFSKGKRLNVRMQAKFCQAHKRQAAMRTWESRQYPKVEWDGLEERFRKHRELLLGIINGNSSHYRTVLATKIELGQARSMNKEQSLSPGYYGGRGFNLMCDYLVGEFGGMLKEKAVDDKVIAGRGSAAFIQSVLVAELGVQLIKEDMGVSAESARDILEESKSLGDVIHGEI